MPRHDYKCPTCGMVKEVATHGLPEYLFFVQCGECPGQPDMVRLPAAPSFTIRGFSAKNGYSGDR